MPHHSFTSKLLHEYHLLFFNFRLDFLIGLKIEFDARHRNVQKKLILQVSKHQEVSDNTGFVYTNFCAKLMITGAFELFVIGYPIETPLSRTFVYNFSKKKIEFGCGLSLCSAQN